MFYQWSDLARLKRTGLRVVQVIQGEGAETTLVVERENEGLPMNAKPTRPNYLRNRLAEMYQAAKEQPGQAQRIKLGRGLRVDAIIDSEGAFRLQISRKSLYPSDTEWETVLKNLPFEAKDASQPEHFEHKGFCYIRAGWLQGG
jgi:hypothetical protein